jgi:hypothetical protein
MKIKLNELRQMVRKIISEMNESANYKLQLPYMSFSGGGGDVEPGGSEEYDMDRLVEVKELAESALNYNIIGMDYYFGIENFIKGDSKSNYQSEQAKIAIATGGVIGKGPGNSTQRAFLPQASSDFIYAIIIEEYGLFTGFAMLFLYMILLFRGIRILRDSEKLFGGLIAVGLSFSLVFQALINMAVAVNLFPVTGQPLPLVSMGGTSIMFTCIALGIILSVSKSQENETENNNLKAVEA